jgi:SAM-dependent methyltransferase
MIRQLHNRLVFGRRIQVLEQHLSDMIPVGSRVLDVGCGDGSIDKLILKRRPDITIDGIDILMRHHAHISVTQCSGKDFPFPDKAFDAAIFVDVLHHTDDPMKLLEEARRVARRSIIIKDHNLNGIAARIILRLMDWIGNAPHGVVLTYNYWPRSRWQWAFKSLGLDIGEYRDRLGLYPTPASWVFERSLHFVTRLDLN